MRGRVEVAPVTTDTSVIIFTVVIEMDFTDRPTAGFALRHRQLFSWSNAGSALGEFHLEVEVVDVLLVNTDVGRFMRLAEVSQFGVHL
jgi:hypothetical protein